LIYGVKVNVITDKQQYMYNSSIILLELHKIKYEIQIHISFYI